MPKTKKKIPNHRLVKQHRTYTVGDISELFGMHENTVRGWIKNDGLLTIDRRRPMLIKGTDLIQFIENRRTVNKKKCKEGELFCVACRAPQIPLNSQAEYQPFSETSGKLSARCPQCRNTMNRFIKKSELARLALILKITIQSGE